MYTEWTLYVLLSGVAFVVALASVMRQWLKSDADVAVAENGLRLERDREQGGAAMMASLGGTAPSERDLPEARTAAADQTEARDLSKPQLIAEDEGAVARLCLGWGGGGMLVGMLSGAATHGFVGALLGSVILSAASVGVAVIVALVMDRATLKAWNAAHAKNPTEKSS
jgi:hypothetical protein